MVSEHGGWSSFSSQTRSYILTAVQLYSEQGSGEAVEEEEEAEEEVVSEKVFLNSVLLL